MAMRTRQRRALPHRLYDDEGHQDSLTHWTGHYFERLRKLGVSNDDLSLMSEENPRRVLAW